MRSVRPTVPRLPIHVLTLCVLLLPTAGLATVGEEPSGELAAVVELLGEAPERPWVPEADPCGCLLQLRSCLFAATLSLGRCVTSLPVGDALCYIKYELDIVLCIQQADNCASTCIP